MEKENSFVSSHLKISNLHLALASPIQQQRENVEVDWACIDRHWVACRMSNSLQLGKETHQHIGNISSCSFCRTDSVNLLPTILDKVLEFSTLSVGS
jgi:hypothetical protein